MIQTNANSYAAGTHDLPLRENNLVLHNKAKDQKFNNLSKPILGIYLGQQTYEKMLHIIHHSRNTSQNHCEIPPHAH